MKKLLKSLIALLGYRIDPKWTIPLSTRQLGNITYLFEMYERVADIPGAIVECGVGRCRTFLYLTHFAEREGKGRRVFGFDSFAGFPEPTKEDTSPRNAKRGEWNYLTPGDVPVILRTAGVPAVFVRENVTLVQGFVEDTLLSYAGGPIALLHLDLDLYSAYKTSLERLVPFVSEGGLVLFDEYEEKEWPGARKAIDEFLVGKPWKLERHPASGKYFFRKTSV